MDSPLVTTQWVVDQLEEPDVRVLDVTVQIDPGTGRVRSGRGDYETGHIPGSGFADLLDDLSDPATPGRMMLPSAARFARAMGSLGVGPGARVVLYDRRENMWAARLWWMLRAFGFDEAAVLDGGWAAWRAAGHPVCSTPCTSPSATFDPQPRPGVFVGIPDVLAAIDSPDTAIVNALGHRQHRGEVNAYGRPGHIPGSANISAWDILDRSSGTYLPVDAIRSVCGPLLDSERLITYCGGGIAASSLALALHHAGHTNIAIYDGSLREWCADPALPLELGD